MKEKRNERLVIYVTKSLRKWLRQKSEENYDVGESSHVYRLLSVLKSREESPVIDPFKVRQKKRA